MKKLLMTLICGTVLCVAICVYGQEDEETVDDESPEPEVSVDDSEDENSEPETETEVPTEDPEKSDSASEPKPEETEEGSQPPPTAPWKRLPVSTKIPVNYDIDLPQDI